MSTQSIEQIKRLVAAKYPLVYVVSWEERRVEGIIKKIAESGFSTPFKFSTWSQTDGLIMEGKPVADTHDPVKALDVVMKCADGNFFSFRDLHVFLTDQYPEVTRKLRDVFHQNKNSVKPVFMISPMLRLPEALGKEVTVVDFELPSKKELESLLDAMVQGNKAITTPVAEDVKQQIAQACLGLTIDETRAAISKTMMGRNTLTIADLAKIFDEKRNLVRKEGILEFVDIGNFSLEEVGGLDNLKEWLKLRQSFFTKEATDFGIDSPKGVLLTGIPGCGKSVCVRAIAAQWHLPIFRLDMDRVYSGSAGTPEEGLRRALKTVEAASPAILWIDEIEKGVAGYSGSTGGGTEARVFGLFLTWMQDKKKLVFIAATANEVDKLPPEILRKGRFDEIFFVDLPTEAERSEIFAVHLRLHKQDVGRFDLGLLAKGTNGFSGSEIEQIVLAGLFEAFGAKRELTNNDLHKAAGRMVALSVTMAERIKDLKRWAQYRAVKATKGAIL